MQQLRSSYSLTDLTDRQDRFTDVTEEEEGELEEGEIIRMRMSFMKKLFSAVMYQATVTLENTARGLRKPLSLSFIPLCCKIP